MGLAFACALRVDGKVDCWGQALSQRFASESEPDKPQWGMLSYTYGDPLPEGVPPMNPIDMYGFQAYSYGEEGEPEVLPFTSISVGAKHACGLHTDSSVECWRSDSLGFYRYLPDSFSYVDAGFHNHACLVIKANGGVVCLNDEGDYISHISPTTPDACLQGSCYWANDDELEQ